MTTSMRPRSIRLEQTSEQVIGDETLVYDEIRHQAWCLNKSSACIWRHCDGQKTIEQISVAASSELNAPVTAEIVLLTLAELLEKNLLEPQTATHLPESVTRRKMISKAGLAAAALLPVIASVLTPPAHAQGGSLTGMARSTNSKSNV
jgi:Coenzyme PQQ synthesis protein D (PqqD)